MDVAAEKDEVEGEKEEMSGSKRELKKIAKHGVKRDEITTQAKFDKKKKRKEKYGDAERGTCRKVKKGKEESEEQLAAPVLEEDLSSLL